VNIIITRPEGDATPLAEKLRQRGHTSLVLPLLAIVPRKDVAIPDKPYQAVLITSANGLAGLVDALPLPVLCVGPQSAAAARAKGFAHVEAEGGDVAGLVAHVRNTRKPADGPLLYLSGSTTSGDLEGQLAGAGYAVDRVMTYDAVPSVPAQLADHVAHANAVMLYSPRTTRLWLQALAETAADAVHLLHFCLSPAVAQPLPQSWSKRIAAAPTEGAMLAALDQAAEQE
jgi:uroporphyrinogen-III synthase